jgi:uncharacterized protein (TIGR02145 family)
MKNRFLQFSIAILVVLFFGCSTSSDGNGNSTTTVVPLAPTGLTGTVVSPTQSNLSWTDNSTNETGFKIERRTGSANYAVVGTVNQDVLSFSDSGLTPSTTYTYRVYAFNSVGSSLTYSNEVTITTSNSTAINVPGPDVTDIDGNTYQSITNCGLTFTKQNLNVSKYSDGTSIPQVTDVTQWANLTTGAWCYYNNATANGKTYGKLYNWYAVAGIYDAASEANPALRKKLAPSGWHVPSDSEWTQLTDCLGGTAVAGGKMKATGTIQAGTGLWQNPNTDASNASGFSGLPGGGRFSTGGGNYVFIPNDGIWFSSSEVDLWYAWNRYLYSYNSNIYRFGDDYKKDGFSVRCVKD